MQALAAMGDSGRQSTPDRNQHSPQPGCQPAALTMWRLDSPHSVASPALAQPGDVCSPPLALVPAIGRQPSLSSSAGALPADCAPLCAQPTAPAGKSPPQVAARPADSAMLRARFAAAGDQSLQCASVPEHAPSPPLALPPACLHASGLDGDWPHGGPPRGDAPALRDSCPAVSERPRFASDAPLRPVAGSAEWPLSRSGQPRPMLQIPDTFNGATGRYCDADLLSTPGAALPSASPGPATSGYSDGVNMASFCSRTVWKLC